MGQATAVNVERLQDIVDIGEIEAPLPAPQKDVEVFFSGFEAVEDADEQEGVFVEASLQ